MENNKTKKALMCTFRIKQGLNNRLKLEAKNKGISKSRLLHDMIESNINKY